MKSKKSVPASAGELYTSPLFKGLRAYATANADVWYILSAEHGLVSPSEIIAPYERTLNNMSRAEQVRWAERVWNQLLPVLSADARVIVLAGVNYRRHLLPLLKQAGIGVSVPLEGLSIGRQLARLKELAAHGFRDE